MFSGFGNMRATDPWGYYGGNNYSTRSRDPYYNGFEEDPYYYDSYASRAARNRAAANNRRNNPWYEVEEEDEPQYYQPYDTKRAPARKNRTANQEKNCDCADCRYERQVELERAVAKKKAIDGVNQAVGNASNSTPVRTGKRSKKTKLPFESTPSAPVSTSASTTPTASQMNKKRQATAVPESQPKTKAPTPVTFPSPAKSAPILSLHGSCIVEDSDDEEYMEPDRSGLTLPRDHPTLLEVVDAV
jgi:hypothetical protein